MSFGDIMKLAAEFGPSGVIIGYLMWERYSRDRREEKKDEQRGTIEKERIEADLEMARALTLLSERVDRVRAL